MIPIFGIINKKKEEEKKFKIPDFTSLGISATVGLGIGASATGGATLSKPTPEPSLGLPNLGLPTGPMSKPEDKPDPTWGNVIKYSLKSGLGQYQSSLANVLRLIDMGVTKLTDPIQSLISINPENAKKFKEKYGFDPNINTTEMLTKIVEDSDKIATKSAEQAESKNKLKQFLNLGLQSAPQIIGAGILGAGIPIAEGIAAAKPTAEIVTRVSQMIPFGIGAAGAHARDIEKEYEALGKEAPYLSMVAGGLLGGAGEMATELPVFLSVAKLLKTGGKELINEGAKNLLGKYGKLGINFIKDLALQSWQEAEMVPIERSINKAVGLPQDMFKGLVKEMGVNAYGGLAMALVLGGLGGSAIGSAFIANKTMEAVDNVIKNKGDIREAIRKVAEIQGFMPEEAKPVTSAYIEETPKAKVKEPISDEIDKKIRDILDKDKELLAITEEYKKTTKPDIWGSGNQELLKKEADLYTEKYNKLLEEELKAKGEEPVIPDIPKEEERLKVGDLVKWNGDNSGRVDKITAVIKGTFGGTEYMTEETNPKTGQNPKIGKQFWDRFGEYKDRGVGLERVGKAKVKAPTIPIIEPYTPYQKMNMLKTGARVNRLKALYGYIGEGIEKVNINGKIESLEAVIKRTQQASNLPELEKAGKEITPKAKVERLITPEIPQQPEPKKVVEPAIPTETPKTAISIEDFSLAKRQEAYDQVIKDRDIKIAKIQEQIDAIEKRNTRDISPKTGLSLSNQEENLHKKQSKIRLDTEWQEDYLIDKKLKELYGTKNLTDLYNQTIPTRPAEQLPEGNKPIPKELEPLAEEARKYGSKEEFSHVIDDATQRVLSKYERDIKGLKSVTPKEKQKEYGRIAKLGELLQPFQTIEGYQRNQFTFVDKLKDFYTQATAGVKAVGKGEATIPVTEKTSLAETPVEEVKTAPVTKVITEKTTEEDREFIKIKDVKTLVTPDQIKQAHTIANDKNMIVDGKIRAPYRQLAKLLTEKTSIKRMTFEEADTFINALNILPTRGERLPPRTPSTIEEITPEFINKIPTFKEIGFLEKGRPSWRVFQKIGLFKEVFEPTFKAGVESIEELSTFRKDIAELRKSVTPSKEVSAKIFNALEHPKLYKDLSIKEKKVADWARIFYDDWANRLGLTREDRLDNYVTHIFEKQIEEDLKNKFPLDPNLIQALDFITPKTIFNPFLQHRIGKTTGLKQDIWSALDAYEGKALKKFYYEPIIQRIRIYIKYLPESSSRYLRDFILRMSGRPLIIDKEVNQNLKEAAEHIKNLPYGKKLSTFLTQGNASGMMAYNIAGLYYESYLGLNPAPAIKNASQGFLTIAETGIEAYIKTQSTLGKKRSEMLKDSLVFRSRKAGNLPGIDETFIKQLDSKRRKVTMFLFNIMETKNVGDAYLSGYYEAEGKGLSKEWCIKRGDEVAAKTQFLYGKLSAPQLTQNAIGRVLGVLTTWTENWSELMNDWIQGKPSEVYKEYEKTTGKKITPTDWFARRKSLWIYMAIVAMAMYIERTNKRIKALEYTGWNTLRNLANLISGELAGLRIFGAAAKITSGILMGDKALIKTGWNEIRPDKFISIVKKLEDIVNGKKDWLSIFFDLNKEKKAKPEPIIIGKPSISKFAIPQFSKPNTPKFSIPKFGK